MQTPELLTKGDTVAIVAASGICDSTKLANGVNVIESMGLKVKVMPGCYASHDYLAGTDHQRLQDLHEAFADVNIKGIFMARGGYGTARLLPYIDYALIRKNPKVVVGFSDITALHIALNQLCGLVTFHGPMPVSCLSDAALHPQTLESLTSAIFKSTKKSGTAAFHRLHAVVSAYTSRSRVQFPMQTKQIRNQTSFPNILEFLPPDSNLQTLYPGQASGILTGGNLSVIASTLGTPYEIKTRGRILFLEDVNEEPYRVDRLLLQLKLAGKLSAATGIIFGDFSPETLETLQLAINEIVLTEKKPTAWGLSCGHTSPNFTLPLGKMVAITV